MEIKKIASNWRYYILAILFGFSAVCVVSCPVSDGITWIVEALVSKAIGILGFTAFWSFFCKWRKDGKINEINQLLEED